MAYGRDHLVRFSHMVLSRYGFIKALLVSCNLDTLRDIVTTAVSRYP
jgi:hypothetical protein